MMARHSRRNASCHISHQGKEQGFTLMELLIAVAIFALIGVAGYRMLNSVVSAFQKTSVHADEFSQLQQTVALIDQDLKHIVARKIKDELGGDLPAVAAAYRGGLPFEFTRNGRWRFPDETQSELIRIGYQVEDGNLQRLIWPVLDRAQDTRPQVQTLLKNVSGLQIRLLGAEDGWSDSWPMENNQGQTDMLQLPKAIDLRFQTRNYGQIQRLVTLDGL